MGYWSHNVEKMDDIIEENLPDPWKTKIEKGEIELIDIPNNVQWEAFEKGEANYWGSLIDKAYEEVREGNWFSDKRNVKASEPLWADRI